MQKIPSESNALSAAGFFYTRNIRAPKKSGTSSRH